MNPLLLEHIGDLIGSPITKVTSVSGGDISAAYCLHMKNGRLFCKLNGSHKALDMFKSEKRGLEAIAQTNTVKTPKVFFCDQVESNAFLIMEYIEPKAPSKKNMELFGHQLAEMHHTDGDFAFGWTENSFIGSLPQSNNVHPDWTTFYVKERLQVQLDLARNNAFLQASEIPSIKSLIEVCDPLFQNISPSILHGDLWGGNYIIDANGAPYLIDPSVYYGHSEVDLAMSRLFGGFDGIFYAAYYEQFPLGRQKKEYYDLYQLYYLLVHLNMFGSSYYPSVKKLLNTYFDQY